MTKLGRSLFSVCLMLFVSSAGAAWVDVSAGLLAGKTPDWPGKTGGCAVNRLNGDLYVKVCGLGIYKSTDQGANYTRVDGNMVSGRNESAFAWDQDQANPVRMATFSLDGNAGGALDGSTWKSFAGMGRNWDFGSVDWVSTTPSVMMVTLHESGGKVYLSTDAGTSWQQVNITVVATGGVGAEVIAMVGVLDANTLIYCTGGGIQRSTNRGASWSQASTINVLTRTPHVFKGVAYFGNASGLVVSSDNGATWHQQGAALTINQGPFFGADENTMVVANQLGLYKTTNAGQTWTKLPPTVPTSDFDPRWYGHYAWDPVHNIAYASRMGNPAVKWELGPLSVSNKTSESALNRGIFITRSGIRSATPISKVEVYLPSGKMVYKQNVVSAKAVTLPRFSNASGSMLMVRVSTVDGNVTRLWR